MATLYLVLVHDGQASQLLCSGQHAETPTVVVDGGCLCSYGRVIMARAVDDVVMVHIVMASTVIVHTVMA